MDVGDNQVNELVNGDVEIVLTERGRDSAGRATAPVASVKATVPKGKRVALAALLLGMDEGGEDYHGLKNYMDKIERRNNDNAEK